MHQEPPHWSPSPKVAPPVVFLWRTMPSEQTQPPHSLSTSSSRTKTRRPSDLRSTSSSPLPLVPSASSSPPFRPPPSSEPLSCGSIFSSSCGDKHKDSGTVSPDKALERRQTVCPKTAAAPRCWPRMRPCPPCRCHRYLPDCCSRLRTSSCLIWMHICRRGAKGKVRTRQGGQHRGRRGREPLAGG